MPHADTLSRPTLFALIGAGNTVLDLAIYAVAVAAGTLPAAANVASYSAGIVSSYILNGVLTFKIAGSALLERRRVAAFVAVNLVGLVIGTAVVALLAPPLGALAAKLASLPATFAWNFAMSRRYAFTSPG